MPFHAIPLHPTASTPFASGVPEPLATRPDSLWRGKPDDVTDPGHILRTYYPPGQSAHTWDLTQTCPASTRLGSCCRSTSSSRLLLSKHRVRINLLLPFHSPSRLLCTSCARRYTRCIPRACSRARSHLTCHGKRQVRITTPAARYRACCIWVAQRGQALGLLRLCPRRDTPTDSPNRSPQLRPLSQAAPRQRRVMKVSASAISF